VKTNGRMAGLLEQPPDPHITGYSIKPQASGRNCELIFDDQLGVGFEAREFAE